MHARARGQEQHQIRTSPKVKVDGVEASIGYMKLFRSGENYGLLLAPLQLRVARLFLMLWAAGGQIAGQVLGKDGQPVKEYSAAGTKGTVRLRSSPTFLLQIAECGLAAPIIM
jgi:hypothetical protein